MDGDKECGGQGGDEVVILNMVVGMVSLRIGYWSRDLDEEVSYLDVWEERIRYRYKLV